MAFRRTGGAPKARSAVSGPSFPRLGDVDFAATDKTAQAFQHGAVHHSRFLASSEKVSVFGETSFTAQTTRRYVYKWSWSDC